MQCAWRGRLGAGSDPWLRWEHPRQSFIRSDLFTITCHCTAQQPGPATWQTRNTRERGLPHFSLCWLYYDITKYSPLCDEVRSSLAYTYTTIWNGDEASRVGLHRTWSIMPVCAGGCWRGGQCGHSGGSNPPPAPAVTRPRDFIGHRFRVAKVIPE